MATDAKGNFILSYDLPEDFLENEDAVLVLDKRHNIYLPRQESSLNNALVYVERCVVRKDKYVELDPLSKKSDLDAYLVKETNFTDIGGGLRQFERHYLTFPSSWFDYQPVSYRAVWFGAINYRNLVGQGATWDITRTALAKATRHYFFKDDLPTTAVPEGDNVGKTFVNDFNFTYTIAPESRIGRNWDGYTTPQNPSEIAIAPDKISVYLGEIYELTRFTMTV